MENILLFFSLKYRGNWDRIYLALEQKELVLKSELSRMKNMIDSDYLTILDSKFPENLKQCSNPPFVLYTCGNQQLLNNYDLSIAIVGGENYERYGAESVQYLLEDWCQKRCLIIIGSNMLMADSIISFLAKNDGQLVIVLKEDLMSFKNKNKILIEKFKNQNLLIISEFYQELDSEFDNHNLYNRLIVALSRRLVFVEVMKKETNFAMFTQGLREEKEVYALPERIDSKFDGPNFILKHRGKLVEFGDDVLNSPIYH